MRNPFEPRLRKRLNSDPLVIFLLVHPKQIERIPLGKALTIKLELETVVLPAEFDEDAEIGMFEEEVDHPGFEVGDGGGGVGVAIKTDDGTLAIPTEQSPAENPIASMPHRQAALKFCNDK